MSEPSLAALITAVDTAVAPDASPLDRLATARRLADTLRARSDELLDHYVDAARAADSSWTEIGCTLGVTKQAAQQRYVALTPPAAGELPSGLKGPAAAVFLAAAAAAHEHGHHYLGPEHLVLGLLAQPEELAGRALAELGVTLEAANTSLVERRGSGPARPDGSLGVAPQTKRLLELANAFAKRLGHNCTRTEHILLAAVAPRLHSPAAALLADCGAGAEAVRDQLAAMLLPEAPELANRLYKRWPLATVQIRGIRS
ncbi:MAG TPA: Clp protease N-terminal domain-containing protein [Solirubrobacteraceae bacterium]|nr:Clp protease N-terminal domain-containing protein [Solirubrobacteraceae bacterium]